ncbi:MAG: 50S ribosomal protein L21 [Candidatus Saganbacteria bacterium]|nr:50S ribosomal protein L21 [Candidatus Saganbacteria bacterium]
MYAIIESGNKQYKVGPGSVIDVELLALKKDETVAFDKVLLVSDDDAIKIGTPYVKGATVESKVLDEIKDKKVVSFKYKNKINYHRTIGHRQKYTRLQVEKIST